MFWSCMSLTKTVVNSIPEAGFSIFFLEISIEIKDNRIFRSTSIVSKTV